MWGRQENSRYSRKTETEIVAEEETETEVVAEEETEATEQETETEEPVLFRIRISYEGGVNLGNLPSAKEINELIWVDNGTEFDVYEIRENYRLW